MAICPHAKKHQKTSGRRRHESMVAMRWWLCKIARAGRCRSLPQNRLPANPQAEICVSTEPRHYRHVHGKARGEAAQVMFPCMCASVCLRQIYTVSSQGFRSVISSRFRAWAMFWRNNFCRFHVLLDNIQNTTNKPIHASSNLGTCVCVFWA